MMRAKQPGMPKRHISDHIRLWLNGLIVLALTAAAIGVFLLHRMQGDITHLETRLRAVHDTRSDRIVVEAATRYQLQKDTNPLDALNDTLTTLGLADAVMELSPGSPVVQDDIRGFPVKLRLSPVPGHQISALLNAIEHDSPRFMIVSLSMTRIRRGDDAVDVVLEVIVFENTGIRLTSY